MLDKLRNTGWRILEAVGKLFKVWVIVMLVSGVFGLAYGLADTSPEAIHIDPATNYIIPGAVLIQLIGVGIWIGKNHTQTKQMILAVDTIGKKYDKLITCFSLIDKTMSEVKNEVRNHSDRITRLEVIQQKCEFFNRTPGEFVVKD